MERIFRRAAALRKYKSGVFAPYMGTLVNDWCQEGYSVGRVQQMLSVLFEFGCWTKNRRIPIHQITVDHAKFFIRRKQFRVRGMLAPIMRLLEVLVARGCIKALRPPLSAIEQVLEQFSAYLADERSCAQSTVRSHKDAARLFLVWKFGTKSLKYSDIGPADFPGFIGSTAKGRGHSAYLGCGVRAFLRFLLRDGRVSFDLSGAVPPARRWRYSTIPRNLTADQVKRILASCDRSRRCGRRSYAVLLLLSRLGLRSVEIRRILLGDVDWKEGVLTVRGKGGKLSTLPLPHDVGVAMIRYLRKDWCAPGKLTEPEGLPQYSGQFYTIR